MVWKRYDESASRCNDQLITENREYLSPPIQHRPHSLSNSPTPFYPVFYDDDYMVN